MQSLFSPFQGKVCRDSGHSHGDIDRLGDIVISPEIQGRDDVLAVRSACHHDDGHLQCRVDFPDLAEHFQTAHFGHLDVQHDQVKIPSLDSFQPLGSALGRLHAIASALEPS